MASEIGIGYPYRKLLENRSSIINAQQLDGQSVKFFFFLMHPTNFSFDYYLCIYFWLWWVFVAVQAFLQLQQAGATLQLRCAGFSLRWRLCCGACALGRSSAWVQQLQCVGSVAAVRGFSSCSSRVQQLRHMGLVFPQHVESSWTRDQSHISCISRWILYH